jgi:GH25 family lysozyme M1 (1,4-beta-N-acetylmuramidase)
VRLSSGVRLAALAAVVALALPALPAAAQVTPAAPAAGGRGGTGHFNVGAAHSPQLTRALAARAVPRAVSLPGMSASSFRAAVAEVGLPGAVQGVDVAAFQHPESAQYPAGGPINWTQAAGAGIAFAAVKATEGNYYVNPFYAGDLAGASAAGLKVMGYAFANPKAGNGTAADQAQYLVNHAGTVNGRTPPLMLDMEYNPYSGGECYGLNPDAMVTWISQFDAELQALTGQFPILYTTQDWWALCTGGSTAFSSIPMWDAAFTTAASPPLPTGWGDWALWQYTSAGTVPGITSTGATDRDALNLVSPGDQQATVGQPVSLAASQFAAGPGPGLAYRATGLPAGLAIDATGVISGTPGVSDAAVPATITAAAEGSVLGSVSLTWDIQGPVSLTPPADRTTQAGSPVDFKVPAVSPPPGQATSVRATGLPPGVSVSSAGQFLGWPAQPGRYHVTVTATDSAGDSGVGEFTWAVTAAPATGPAGAVRLGAGSRCLQDTGNSSAAGNPVQAAACNGSAAQSWTMARDQSVRIHGKCLAVLGAATANGARVGLAACSGAAAQRWSGRAGAELVNAAGGKCLADPFAGPGAAWLWSCSGQAGQQWTLPAGPVTSQIPGGCLNDPNQSTVNGTAVQVWPCNGRPAQAWTATAGSALQVRGKCLQAARAASGASRVYLNTCAHTTAQQWTVAASGAGVWYRNAAYGQCLANPGTAPAAHPAVTLGPCTAAGPAITWQHV